MPTLVVQKGHCYRSTGATGTNGEQAFATAVADACVALLNGRGGWTVRVIVADASSASYRGDAFVAIHADGSINASVRGASVGYRTPEGQAAGQAWKRAYAARGWPGGFRPDNYTTALAQYYGTGTAVGQGNRRAFIIESGFLTSPEDRAVLTGPGGAARVALAIGDALGISGTQQGQQEDDMTPEEHGWLAGLDSAVGVTWTKGQGLLGDVLLRLEAKFDAVAKQLTNDEANIIAAVRQIVTDDPDATVDLTPEQVDHFAQLVLGSVPATVRDAVREAFARAGAN